MYGRGLRVMYSFLFIHFLVFRVIVMAIPCSQCQIECIDFFCLLARTTFAKNNLAQKADYLIP